MATEATQNGRKNNSSIDFANKGIGMVQNARNAQKIASTIQKAKKIQAAVSIAASTWEIWVPILIIGIIVILFFAIISAIFGGNNSSQSATSQQPIPTAEAGPPPTASNDVLSWGAQILSAVQPFPAPCGQMYINNVMLQTITNGSYTAKQRPGSVCGIGGSSYYCTDLVIDAYNLAGIKNNFSRGVAGMIVQWASMIPGATVRKSSNVDGLQPGDAVFWLTTNNTLTAQHVAIVQSINVSQNGNGTLTTIDSNTNHKANTFAVHNWILDGKNIGGLVAWFGLKSR